MEVMISALILTMVTLGVLSTLLSTRQMTDFARKQLLVDTAIQGILEQLKNQTLDDLLTSPTPTWFSTMAALKTYKAGGGAVKNVSIELDNNSVTPLKQLIISPYDPTNFDPATQIRPGAVPSDPDNDGYGDVTGDGQDDVGVNLLTLDVKGTTGLNNSLRLSGDDLKIYLMVFITDTTQSSEGESEPSRQIIIYYTWTYREGSITRPIVDSVRAIRGTVL